jgi:hypothetical protein
MMTAKIRGLELVGSDAERQLLAEIHAAYDVWLKNRQTWFMIIVRKGGNIHPDKMTQRQKVARKKAIVGRRVNRRNRG